MLIALVTALMLLTGGSSGFLGDPGQFEKQIKAEVADDARKDAAVDVIGRLQEREKGYRESLSDLLDELGEQNAAGALTQQQLDEKLRLFMADVRAYHRGVIDTRFELRELINREEWAAIFAKID